jgi:hypothetical protein
MSEQYNLSKKSIRGLARNNREQRGRLAPITQVSRRIADVFQPVRMIVIERNGLGGSKQNSAIRAGDPIDSFLAAVIDDDTSKDVADLLDPEKTTIVNVSRRFVSTVIFTGQQFIGCGQISSLTKDAVSQFDVIQSPGFTDFFATFRTGQDWNCEVDFTAASQNRHAEKQSSCRIIASNITGQTLVDDQSVIVRLIGGNWVIHEFFCADGYVNPGSDPGIDGTGGGYPLP